MASSQNLNRSERLGANGNKLGRQRTRQPRTMRCAVCGTSFVRLLAAHEKDRKFCSRTCQGAVAAEREFSEQAREKIRAKVRAAWGHRYGHFVLFWSWLGLRRSIDGVTKP